MAFGDSKFFLCIFHILRAVKKKLNKLIPIFEISSKTFVMFHKIATLVFSEQEINDEVENIKNFLLSNNQFAAWDYLNKNYLSGNKIIFWAKAYRDGFSMTNNVSESLNKVIKSYYKLDNCMRMDKLVYLIMHTICNYFVFETFVGKNAISNMVIKNKATILLVKKSQTERVFDNLIKRIRGTFRCGSYHKQQVIISGLQCFIAEYCYVQMYCS